MPLTASEIVVLPYDPLFSEAGVQYARESLHYTYNRMNLKTGDRLRKIVAGVAFEMAFRRWLEAEGVAYSRLGATVFTDPDRFDLAIGGRRCDLKSYLINDRSKIRSLHTDPGWALDADALVADDQFESDRMGENDIYVFGLVTGLEARHSTDTHKALAKGLPASLMHTPPRDLWANRHRWRPLGAVALKSSASAPVEVEIGGQSADRSARRERVELLPRLRTVLTQSLHSVLYLAVPRIPDGKIGLRSPALQQTCVIEPADWINIWVYGQRIYLCGWLNKHDFRAKSRALPAGSPARQYRRTAVANRALPMRHLRSMNDLLEIAKKFAHRKGL